MLGILIEVTESTKYTGKLMRYYPVKKDVFAGREEVSDEVWSSLVGKDVDVSSFENGDLVDITKDKLKFEGKDFWFIKSVKLIKKGEKVDESKQFIQELKGLRKVL